MRDPSKPVPRGVYILPNLFTTASLFAGFLSITMAFAGNFDDAAWAILFSALMDGLDGKVARLTGSASQFGVEYDSLADAIAFGVAPGVLAWAWQLHHFGRLGLAAAFLFAACGALRLARFNVSVATTSKRFFIGLPIPAGGCTFATFVLFLPHLPEFMLGAVPHMALGLSFLAPAAHGQPRALLFLQGIRLRQGASFQHSCVRAADLRTALFHAPSVGVSGLSRLYPVRPDLYLSAAAPPQQADTASPDATE